MNIRESVLSDTAFGRAHAGVVNKSDEALETLAEMYDKVDEYNGKLFYSLPKIRKKALAFTPNKDPQTANDGPIGTGLGIAESLPPQPFYLAEAVEKHDDLNPDLFEDNELRPEVADKIREIVDKFTESLENDKILLDVKDVLIVGSNASFNYSDTSDIDVHIIADTSVYEDKEDLAVKVYQAYKRLFNWKYDPTIRGHEVELYVDPDENHARSNGIYSLDSGWIKEPEEHDIPDIDQDAVDKIVEPYIKSAEAAETIEDIDQVIDDIYVLRQKGILKDGEYSLENLAFKEFRSKGYLDKLRKKKVELENEELTLR